ncbi:adenosylcobalamin-dependent ribonucleoside-diphosphate reductase, partial [Candidatus Gottesmanbacteria bacterium]|nr:adenosylcobalamin-dependent ribonucleoside-diphosphate reductase [Candidatus Gottesmanbacteria bacterium]
WDWHPDIEEFITVKRDLSRINGANLSVCVSDKFMEAVKKDEDWDLIFPELKEKDYDNEWNGYMDDWQAKGKKVKVYKTIKARKLWDLICEAAWASAEPGVVFMERYNKWYNNWYFNKVNCVNPCGEEGLPAWGVCNLTSINLSALVVNGKIDYKTMAEIAKIGVRFQDDVIDADSYVFPQIREVQQNGERRIGLGTMGLGDALIKMKLRYGSPESLVEVDKIYKIIRDAAYESSVEIAREKGAFPKFEAKKHLKGYFVKQLPKHIKEGIKKYGIRNSVLLQQAPTGSTSLLAGVSSGIEPVYEFSFIRRDRLGEHTLYHPLYEEWKLSHANEPVPNYFVSANDLSPEEHVRIQATIQKYVDASISKTVNAPKTHTVEDVKNLYTLAYDLGCKGIAYMREGSRPGVLERIDNKKETLEESKKVVQPNGHAQSDIKPRPMVVQGSTYQIDTPVGAAFVTINTNGNKEPLEIFINVGKAGSDVAAMAEAMGRLASLVLRMQSLVPSSVRAKQIFNQLIGIGGSRSMGFGDKRVRSLPDAVAKVLAMHFDFKSSNGNGHVEIASPSKAAVLTQQALPVERSEYDLCPSCGVASLAYEEGCKKCYSCGYSEC